MNVEFIFDGTESELAGKMEEFQAKMEELGMKGDVNYDVMEVTTGGYLGWKGEEEEPMDSDLEEAGFRVTRVDDGIWGTEEEKEEEKEKDENEVIISDESGSERVYRKDE